MQIVVSGLSEVRRNPVVIVKLSRMRLRSVICAILISSEDLCFKEKKNLRLLINSTNWRAYNIGLKVFLKWEKKGEKPK